MCQADAAHQSLRTTIGHAGLLRESGLPAERELDLTTRAEVALFRSYPW